MAELNCDDVTALPPARWPPSCLPDFSCNTPIRRFPGPLPSLQSTEAQFRSHVNTVRSHVAQGTF